MACIERIKALVHLLLFKFGHTIIFPDDCITSRVSFPFRVCLNFIPFLISEENSFWCRAMDLSSSCNRRRSTSISSVIVVISCLGREVDAPVASCFALSFRRSFSRSRLFLPIFLFSIRSCSNPMRSNPCSIFSFAFSFHSNVSNYSLLLVVTSRSFSISDYFCRCFVMVGDHD